MYFEHMLCSDFVGHELSTADQCPLCTCLVFASRWLPLYKFPTQSCDAADE